MDAVRRDFVHLARIAKEDVVARRDTLNGLIDQGDQFWFVRDGRNIGLCTGVTTERKRNEAREVAGVVGRIFLNSYSRLLHR